MGVPNRADFTLQDVVNAINPTTDDLQDCVNDAIEGYYDTNYYTAPATSLKEFRNYGNEICTLNDLQVSTTDPTNANGDNGTATITYSGNVGSVTYNINGGSFISAPSSPFTINNLQESTAYTIIVKDSVSNECQKQATFTLGQTTFTFDTDYLMITYEFTDGQDLDTRTRIVTPDVGQNDQTLYLGWGRLSEYPTTGTPYETWGGDNQGTGFESVLIDINEFLAAYPAATDLVIDARAFWYNSVGVNPVKIEAVLWKGGTPVKSGFKWVNTTADTELIVESTGKVITTYTTDRTTSGERVATFSYNFATKSGVLNNNDTSTPSV
jgi:hypothetical protein